MTRIEAIASMAKSGTPPAEIAARMGIDRAVVGTTLFRLRKSGAPIPYFKRGRPSNDAPGMPAEVATALGKEARRRGVSRESLSMQILSVVALDDLFKAVLDTSDREAA